MENLPRQNGSSSGSHAGREGIWAGKHKFSVSWGRATLHLPGPENLGGLGSGVVVFPHAGSGEGLGRAGEVTESWTGLGQSDLDRKSVV